MNIFGKKSGFKTARDLLLCLFGLSICGFHVFTTPPDKLSMPLLLFGGGFTASPAVIRNDERKGNRNAGKTSRSLE